MCPRGRKYNINKTDIILNLEGLHNLEVLSQKSSDGEEQENFCQTKTMRTKLPTWR